MAHARETEQHKTLAKPPGRETLLSLSEHPTAFIRLAPEFVRAIRKVAPRPRERPILSMLIFVFGVGSLVLTVWYLRVHRGYDERADLVPAAAAATAPETPAPAAPPAPPPSPAATPAVASAAPMATPAVTAPAVAPPALTQPEGPTASARPSKFPKTPKKAHRRVHR
jgi:hypothetical protein